jgi:hypothetical protein
MLCFEWVRAISVCGAEPFAKVALGKPGRNTLSLSLGAPIAPSQKLAGKLKFSSKQKLIFWRFEQIASVCFLRFARCSISGVWRFNLAEFVENGAGCESSR